MPDQPIKKVFVEFTADSSQLRAELTKDEAAIKAQQAQLVQGASTTSASLASAIRTGLKEGMTEELNKAGVALDKIGPKTKGASDGLKQVSISGQGAATAAKALAAPVLNELAPGLGQLASVGKEVGGSFGSLGAAAGVVGVAIAATAMAVTSWINTIKEANAWQDKLRESMVGTDIGKASAAYDEQSAKLRQLERDAARALQPVTGMRSGLEVLTGSISANSAALTVQRGKVAEATAALDAQWQKVAQAQLFNQTLQETAAAAEAAARNEMAMAGSGAAVAAAGINLKAAMADQNRLRKEAIDLQIQQIQNDPALTALQRADMVDAANQKKANSDTQYHLAVTQLNQQMVAQQDQMRKKAEEDYQADIQRQAALLAARVANGQATMAEELAFNERRVADTRNTAEQQMTAVTNLRTQLTTIDQTYFNIRRTLGDATLADEVKRQQDIVDATQKGTKARLDAEVELANKTKALRDQQLSVTQRAINAAVDALVAAGRDITQSNIASEVQKMFDQGATAMQRFTDGMSGVGATAQEQGDNLKKGFDMASLAKDAKDVGGLMTAMGAAGSSALAQLQGKTEDWGKALNETIATGRSINLDAGLARMEGSWDKSLTAMLAAADTFIETLNAKINAGTSRVADSLYAKFVGRLVTDLEDEAARS
jgi:hypothetical protein